MRPEETTQKEAFWQRHYCVLRNAAIAALHILYLILGAIVFNLLEAKAEADRQEKATLKLQQLLENLTCISHGDLQQLLAVTKDLSGAEVWRDTNSSVTVQHPPGQWSVDSALFFSMTVLTTIGYGNLAPKTPGGQGFCLFYALFGIPLFLLVLAKTGYHLAHHNRWVTHKLLDSRLPQGSHRFCAAQFVLLVVAGLTFMMLLPSLGFMYLEGWTYPESFYYSFITLSTIGFGDYVIGMDNYLVVKLLFILWIPCGLAWFSAILSTIQMLEDRIVPDKHQHKTHKEICKQCSINNHQDTEENTDSCEHQQQFLLQ